LSIKEGHPRGTPVCCKIKPETPGIFDELKPESPNHPGLPKIDPGLTGGLTPNSARDNIFLMGNNFPEV